MSPNASEPCVFTGLTVNARKEMPVSICMFIRRTKYQHANIMLKRVCARKETSVSIGMFFYKLWDLARFDVSLFLEEFKIKELKIVRTMKEASVNSVFTNVAKDI